MTDHKDMLSCPTCGYELDDCEWSVYGAYGYDGKFCPNCGCKVAKDGRMSEELKPCPFCGGKARLKAIDFDDDYPTNLSEVIWWVMCTECGAHPGEYPAPTEADAVKAWNTRYERTCHMVEQPDGFGSYDDVCSECGAFDSGTPYCWKCGAKVVEE